MASQRIYRAIRHQGLSKYKLISGLTDWDVEQKAAAQLAAWAQEWDRRVRRDREQASKRSAAQAKEEKKAYAIERTKELQAELDSLRKTLSIGRATRHLVDWAGMKKPVSFSEVPPEEPRSPILPREPVPTDASYAVSPSFLDYLLVFPKRRKIDAAVVRYSRDHGRWRADCEAIRGKQETLKRQHAAATKAWCAARADFLLREQARVESVRSLEDDYKAGKPHAIVEYTELVLSESDYPEYFPRSCEVEYRPETKILVVDYALPAPESLPKVKEARYIQARNELQDVPLSDGEQVRLYDDLLYQIVLRSISEIYSSDEIKAIELIAFNGYVRSIDRTTGNEVNACVLSLQTNRAEFLSINLANVDPKGCFKKLKGVGSSKLIGLAPVAPIIKMNRQDARFVPAHEVMNTLDSSSNLAAMDWEDFEHFIRELFSKEFEKDGGEVKVTQASRDGGVDAIAFDPDPIRGGKIVIQAKRYTNTVLVAAVRELYGTVVNEGATKGILVTTADYGPESYEFARDKPLTLLNGSELLFLLKKHGHSFRIDLKEARSLLAEERRVHETV
jgi:restriction system protein